MAEAVRSGLGRAGPAGGRVRARLRRARRRRRTASRSAPARPRCTWRCTRSASAAATRWSCRRCRSSPPPTRSATAAPRRCSPTSTRPPATSPPRPSTRCAPPRTRAVLAVHQGGVPADVAALRAPRRGGLPLVEDAACAAGSATAAGRPAPARCSPRWSFHPRKLITTGEGGMVTTDDAELAARLRRLREHGMSVSAADRHAGAQPVLEAYLETGFNYRMTDIQAAIGLVQLGRLDGIVARRRAAGRPLPRAAGRAARGPGRCATRPTGRPTTSRSGCCWTTSSPATRDEVLADARRGGRLGPARHHGRAPRAGLRGAPARSAAGDRAAHPRARSLPLHHELTAERPGLLSSPALPRRVDGGGRLMATARPCCSSAPAASPGRCSPRSARTRRRAGPAARCARRRPRPARHRVDGLPVLGPTEAVHDHPRRRGRGVRGQSAQTRRAGSRWPTGWRCRRPVRHDRAPGRVGRRPAASSGPGTVLLAGVVLTRAAAVGAHVLAMPQVLLTHDDVVGDFVTLAGRVALGGGVGVGRGRLPRAGGPGPGEPHDRRRRGGRHGIGRAAATSRPASAGPASRPAGCGARP